ncbi:hypothetical protein J6590_007135, partial [Homalodisca vitripennis]
LMNIVRLHQTELGTYDIHIILQIDEHQQPQQTEFRYSGDYPQRAFRLMNISSCSKQEFRYLVCIHNLFSDWMNSAAAANRNLGTWHVSTSSDWMNSAAAAAGI